MPAGHLPGATTPVYPDPSIKLWVYRQSAICHSEQVNNEEVKASDPADEGLNVLLCRFSCRYGYCPEDVCTTTMDEVQHEEAELARPGGGEPSETTP